MGRPIRPRHPDPADGKRPAQGRSAALVGAGVFTSRAAGLLRDMAIAAFIGPGAAMDAFVAALRIPNVLRNLLSEGALSASFVPVFSSFLGERDPAAARRLAQGVLFRLLALSALVVALCVAAAPWFVPLLVPGYETEMTARTTQLVRILFPMSGIMIAGAWCLGILTSHRRFFLPFAAPVLWNVAQIGGLLLGVRFGWGPLVVVLAWSTLAGSALQVGVQLPSVRRLLGTLRPRLDREFEPTRRVVRNMGPVAAGQGIFQLSSLTDVGLTSLLAPGALASIHFAQRIALLPLAIFGASVAVAALPEMSREKDIRALRPHLSDGVRRASWFILPSVAALFLLGDLAASLVYVRGEFTAEDVPAVHWILGASAVGLVATSLTKLLASAYHAVQDTRTPVKFAAAGVTSGIAIGAAASLWLDALGLGTRAAAGIVLGSSIGAWVNLLLLARGLKRRGIGSWLAPVRGPLARMVLGAGLAAGAFALVRMAPAAWLPAGFWGNAILLAAALIAGGLPYVATAGLPAWLRPSRAGQ